MRPASEPTPSRSASSWRNILSDRALFELHHAARDHRYLQVRTGTADAADLTQQVFLRAFASLTKYPESLGRHLGEVVKAFHPSPRRRISAKPTAFQAGYVSSIPIARSKARIGLAWRSD